MTAADAGAGAVRAPHRRRFGDSAARLGGLPSGRVLLVLLALLLGVGAGLMFVGAAAAAPVTIVDDGGPDDEPGQKDLNFLTVDTGLPGATTVNIKFGWDDTATTGANNLDGCALFDTDGDGLANYSLCITRAATGTTARVLFSCGDTASDRCTPPNTIVLNPASSGNAAFVAGSDPFGSDPTHQQANDCDDNPECNTGDMVANITVVLSDLVGPEDPFLLNVCSYPSGPGSDPSDCVVTEGAGFLTIVKAATPDAGTFVFNASAPSTANVSQWTITGSGEQQFIPYTPTTTLDLNEVVPAGWRLDSASCQLQTATPTSTGTPTATGVDNFTIQSGIETICTFNDTELAAALNVVKSSTTASITAAGQVVPYTFTVTNPGNVTLSGVTVTDPNCTSLIAGPTGDTNTDGLLQTTETWVYTCTHTVTQAEIDTNGGGDGDLDNTVTADSTQTGPDTDSLAIPILIAALNVVKSSTTASITAAGQVVPYTFTVTNTGNVTLSGVTVTDPNCTSLIAGPTGDTNTDGLLQTTETWVYTCTHTVTQAEIDTNGGGDGDLDNTVTADSTQTGPDTDSLAIPIAQSPALNVVKSSTTASITAAGQVVPYTFTVTNTGNVTLSGVTVTDPNCTSLIAGPTGDTNTDGLLQTTETWVYTCTHTVTQAEIDTNGGGDGDLDNTVTADSTQTGPDTDSLAIPIAQSPALNVVKSSTTASITAAGQVVPYTFTVTNTGNVTLSGVTVTDPNCTSLIAGPTGDTNTDGLLQTTETWVYTCTHTVTQAEIDTNGGGDGDLDNTVTADSTQTGPDTDSLAIPIAQSPALNVVKSSTTASITAAGQVVPYTFTVTNTGNVTLSGVTVTDPNCTSLIAGPTGDTNTDGLLQTTETWVYTCTHTVTQAEIDTNGGGDGDLDNTVTADSTQTGPDTDSLAIPIAQSPALNVVKSSTTASITAAGQVVPYTFTVTNTGNVTLSGVTVTDPNCTSLIAGPTGDTNTDGLLQTTETWVYTCTHTVTQAEIDTNGGGDGDLDNTVTADSTQTGPDTDSLAIPIAQSPALNVVKSSTTASITAAGQVVPYTFTVTNTGNVTLSGVTVTDPNCTSLIAGPTGDTNTDGLLQTTETWVYTCTHTVTQAEIDTNGGGDGDLDNTVTADSTQTGPDTDSLAIPIAQSPALNVVKSSTTASITAAGQVVPYTFTVTNTGNVTLSGVTVTDPNCTSLIAGPTGDTNTDGLLQTTETWVYTCTHTVTQAEIDTNGGGDGDLDNTVTADSTQTGPDTDSLAIPIAQSPALNVVKTETSSGPYDSVGDVVTYSITVTNTGNQTLTGVEVTDPGVGAVLGTCIPSTPATLAPGDSVTCAATHAITQADIDAGSYTNIATADSVETPEDTDDETVPVEQLPALNVVKTETSPGPYDSVGDVVTYSITVTNTGNQTLTGVEVTDPGVGAVLGPCTPPTPATLAPGDSVTCTATHAVTSADLNAGSYTNIATADSNETPEDTDDETVPTMRPAQPPPPPPPPPSDANIQISPPTDINPVGTNHTLTGHVNINAGAGFVNAPDGTVITFSLTNTGGATAAFVGPDSCTTAGGTGSCTVVISSNATGTTTIRAATDVTVNGVVLHRETDATGGNSGPATKHWADDTVRTDIHNAAHAVVTTVQAGTQVHDNAQVTRTTGTPASVPNPTGSVVFHRYATIDCTGTPVDQTVSLTAGNPSTAESDSFTPTANMSYRADYGGDANYPARQGACEPLTVTPIPRPAIAIVKNPKLQTVPKGGTATFTITVTNTGNVTLTNVHVTDPLAPNCKRTPADIPALASMARGAAVTYNCTRPNVQAAFTNVATATGTPPTGPDVKATDSARVRLAAATVQKKPKVVKTKPKVVSNKKPKVTG